MLKNNNKSNNWNSWNIYAVIASYHSRQSWTYGHTYEEHSIPHRKQTALDEAQSKKVI